MKRYTDRPQDDRGKPSIPLIIGINEKLFKKLFKYTIASFFIEKRLDYTYLNQINEELRKTVVRGFERVDFEDVKNQIVIDEITEELWRKFFPILKTVVRGYNRDFTKKQIE